MKRHSLTMLAIGLLCLGLNAGTDVSDGWNATSVTGASALLPQLNPVTDVVAQRAGQVLSTLPNSKLPLGDVLVSPKATFSGRSWLLPAVVVGAVGLGLSMVGLGLCGLMAYWTFKCWLKGSTVEVPEENKEQEKQQREQERQKINVLLNQCNLNLTEGEKVECIKTEEPFGENVKSFIKQQRAHEDHISQSTIDVGNGEKGTCFFVLDGHGKAGVGRGLLGSSLKHPVTQSTNYLAWYIAAQLPNALSKALGNKKQNQSVEEVIKNTWMDFNTNALATFSEAVAVSRCQVNGGENGVTAVMVLLTDDKVYIVHVGDSIGIAVGMDGTPLYRTRDHTPNDEQERKRLKQENIEHSKPDNVFRLVSPVGGLAMSRCFGNYAFEDVGLTAEPGIKCVDRQNVKFLIICSDGVPEALERKANKKLGDGAWESTIVDCFNEGDNYKKADMFALFTQNLPIQWSDDDDVSLLVIDCALATK